MSLDHTRRTFERLGDEDPLHAVLTRQGKEGNRWDEEEFFELGRKRIAEVLGHVESLDLTTPRGRALDFGCGVGRLTQALAGHFREVVGVDISSSMIEAARRHDRFHDRVRYLVNTTDRLADLEDSSFDFVFSTKTLQHIPPQHARIYVSELVRVLRPGGVLVFQFRNGPHIEPGTLRGRLYHLRRHHLRGIIRRLRGRPGYEMHVLSAAHLKRRIAEEGGRVVDVRDLSRGKPMKSLRFVVVKE